MTRGARHGPVAKFFRARSVGELRSAELAPTQSWVEIRSPETPVYNQKLDRTAFSCSSHTGREKFATGPVSHFVAVVVEMHRGHGAGRRRFLEHHHALFGIAVL